MHNCRMQEKNWERSIPLKSIVACINDGVPSMVGRYKGFIKLLKNSASRCVLQTLCDTPSAPSCKAIEQRSA